MAQALKWVLELQDQMSNPARSIVVSLNQVQQSAERADHTVREMATGAGLERFAEKVFDVGKEFVSEVMHANEFATKTKIALEVLTGSSELAVETFSEARRVAVAIGAPLEDVASSYKTLLLGGENAANLQVVTKAAADLAALKGGTIEQWAQAFADISSKGDLAGRSLMAFKGVMDFDVLGKKLGFVTHGYESLVKQLNQTPVSAHKGIEAMLQTIAAKEGGAIETVSNRMAETFDGTVKSIKDSIMSLFEFDTEDSPVLAFLHAVRDSLKPDGPLVTDVKAGIAAFMEGFGVFVGPGSFKSFLEDVKKGTVLGADFRNTMREVGEDVRSVAEATVLLGKGIVKVAEGINWLHHHSGWTEKELSVTEAQQMQFGARAPEGGGIMSVVGAEAALGAVREVHSSGSSMVEDLAPRIPAHGEGGHFDRPHLAIVGDRPETIIPDSKAGAVGGVHASIHQELHIHADGSLPAEDLAHAIMKIGAGELTGALDTLAQSMGAA